METSPLYSTIRYRSSQEGQECEFISLKCLLDTVPASALFCPPSFSVQQHVAGGGGMAQHGGWSRIAISPPNEFLG